jgi:hypothetical protein
MKPTRPIQAETRINHKPVRSANAESARAQAGKRLRPLAPGVRPALAIEHARVVGGERRKP